ncbi:hypothetical protein Tco_0170633, partial [Tanacetum coccineum]
PKIPQSQGPTPTFIADETTSTGVEVDTRGATTTTSGLDAGLYSGNIHESPLRVKTLEVTFKRNTKKVILSDFKEEEIEAQGRKIKKLDDDPLVSLVKGFVTSSKASGDDQVEDISPTTLEAAKTLLKVASQKPKSVDKGRRYIRRKESKGKRVDTGLDFKEEVSTGFEEFSTGFNADHAINTGMDGVNTGSIPFSTGSGPVSTDSTRVLIIP